MTEKVWVSCSIRPHEISGGLTAKPRNPRNDSSSTMLGMVIVTATIRWLVTFGRMCRVMILRSLDPTATAARTYSIRASARVFERTSRLRWAHPSTVITAMTKAMSHKVFANYLESSGLSPETSVAGWKEWDKQIKEEYAMAVEALTELGLIKK